MVTNVLGLMLMADAFIYLIFYAIKSHRLHIETTALSDKITLTLLLASFVGIIKYTLLLMGHNNCDEKIILFDFIQVCSLAIVIMCVGLKLNQQSKKPNHE